MKDRLEPLYPFGVGSSMALKLMNSRIAGKQELPHYGPSTVPGANDLAHRLMAAGGLPQQARMIKDKRRSLDRAMLYSYQAALIRKWHPPYEELLDDDVSFRPVRALINPNKLKQDYDDKILSTGFENNFHSGDIFEWCNTGTYWLIYLQDLDELAYFRGDIRRCCYDISWLDEDGNEKQTYAAIRGPVETKIDYIQKHKISVDEPNYSLNILFPKNEDTMKQFRRYAKFYLSEADSPDDKICWRVEAVDSISTPGILEIAAVEYYANETEDADGLVGKLKRKPLDPNPPVPPETASIIGDTFIKPKKSYTFYIETPQLGCSWYIEDKRSPVDIIEKKDSSVTLQWCSPYSGQFVLNYGANGVPQLTKTIVVQTLF